MAADNEILQALHTEVARELTERIKAGSAKPQDIANAIKFLKDNGIQSIPGTGSKLDDLAKSLPFTVEDDEEADIQAMGH